LPGRVIDGAAAFETNKEHRMYKWFLAFRYLHTKLIAFFGVAAVMLCVAMVLVVISVMGGFLDTIRARARGLQSDIVLDGCSQQGFPLYEEFGRYLSERLPDIVRLSTPIVYTYGVFRIPANEYTKPTRVLGIRLKEYATLNDFAKGLHYNRYYPDTTNLGPQQMPLAGFSEAGRRLPPDLEAAHARWRKDEKDPKSIAAYDAAPFEHTPYPYVTALSYGDRVFAADVGPPGYVDAELPGLISGCDLLNTRRPDGKFDRFLARGALVTLAVVALSPSGNPIGEPPVRIPLRYADDSRTGIFEIDNLSTYIDFDLLQGKLAMDAQPLTSGAVTKPRTNQLLVGLQPGVDLGAARDRIADVWAMFKESVLPDLSEDDARSIGFVEVLTWEDLQRPFIAAVEKEKVLVTILFGLISVVAIVLVGCIFYMIVEKKTKDIGILKSLGASAQGVASQFIVYAAVVGVVGTILGTVIGSVFVWNINTIQDFLANLNPALRVWSPEVYSFDRIPEEVKRSDVLWIASAAVLSSMVGSLIPATIAGRVWPVRALRYE
jgi:lipoprotein-releasing system permease protein